MTRYEAEVLVYNLVNVVEDQDNLNQEYVDNKILELVCRLTTE